MTGLLNRPLGSDTSGPLEAALSYAARGWPVLPVHSASGGRCSCGQDGCGSAGKHPRLANGLNGATTRPDLLESWWRRWPAASVGIRTGAVSGLVVIDIDPRHGGDETLLELERTWGALPRTPEVKTGGGGRHIYLRHPGQQVRSRAQALGAGVDIKADGGYVLAPPSVHASGECYAWDVGRHPDDLGLAEMPAWTLSSLSARRRRTPEDWGKLAGNFVPRGHRADSLLSMAGLVYRAVRGSFTFEVASWLLWAWAHANLEQPMEDKQITGILTAVVRKEKAKRGGGRVWNEQPTS